MTSSRGTILVKTYLFGIAVIVLIACKSLNKNVGLNEKIIGKWKLDSISTPNMKFVKAGIIEIYNFKNSADFTRDWEGNDLVTNLTGKYILYKTPERSLGTITFIPNFQISGNDTIRVNTPNLYIIELNDNKLQIVEPTKMIDVKDRPSIVFNKHCIYKRIK